MNLPESFRQQMRLLLGSDFDAFEKALLTEPPVSIRVNKPPKFAGDNVYKNLPQVPWCDNGYYLPARPVFTLDPLLHAGAYYVQEAASMCLEQYVKYIINDDGSPKIVLDLCAAPGGKSTHLSSLLPHGSLLVSNEIIRSRAAILYENMTKWGVSNYVICNNDPRDFALLRNFFDIILVDAPCSGEGMFRKDNRAINEWSEGNVKLCAERQRRILADVWDALKPNGYLIYSTCTYNTHENEENVSWLINELGARSVFIDVPNLNKNDGIMPSFDKAVHASRFFPHKTQSEGLFITLLQKNNTNFATTRFRSEKKQYQKLSKEFVQVKKWLTNEHEWTFVQNNTVIYAIPNQYIDEVELLNKNLKTITAGIPIGEIKGTTIVPYTDLALSGYLNRNEFITWDIDTETALQYLRRNAIVAPADMPKGYILLIYNNTPLGWIKNLGTRSNNLYPPEWRIRHL